MNGDAFNQVNYLKLNIERLLKPIDNPLNSECREMFKLVYKVVEYSFEELAQTTLNTALDAVISWELIKLSRLVREIDPNSLSNKDVIKNITEVLVSLITPDKLKMLEQKYSDGLYNLSSFLDDEDEGDRDAVSTEVIGMREVYQKLKDMLILSPPSKVTSLVGMPGIGKTTLATKLFNDPTIVECFDHRVWVQVGKKYRAKDITRRMLEEMHPGSLVGDLEAVGEQLKTSKRYLIVLDDVWDRFTAHLLYKNKWSDQLCIHPESGSRILITSRLQQLNEIRNECSENNMIVMRLLNIDESWDLLRRRVFSQGSCPPRLEKVGKKVSENCEGLPLTILVVARILSQDENKMCSLEYWDEVATKKNHRVFMEAYDEISKVLLPSYTYLPPLLQMCFMFIGLFPKKYEVPRSKLTNLWLADGFLELNVRISTINVIFECLEELVSNNLVMVYKKSSFNFSHKVKTCGLHSSLWHLSKKKATETKFALLLSSRNDALEDGINVHHRVSFLNNVLFGIKEVHKSVEDNCAAAARSLFCFGPYHQYQVPICFRLTLLKELDALSIRFYEFPMEVLQLVRLVYLSLTVSGMIPTSISRLQLLEFLIVDRHQIIKSLKDASYLPVEIWNLKKLKHLQVMGSDLPNPCGASLRTLSTLSDVSVHSCTVAVLKGIPNLRNLKIRIELAPARITCFSTNHFSFLSKLLSLKCVIVNPSVVPPIAPFSSFLKGKYLRNLSLSGLGYPWKEMRSTASLPCLSVLKLKHYAFQGPEWEVEETKFNSLTSLIIEDTDLEDLKIGAGAFSQLRSLTIKQCYKLQKIHGKFGFFFRNIELVDCNPYFVKEIRKIIPDDAIINVHSSWDDEKRKT